MGYSITWVGIDDHKRSLVIAVLRNHERESVLSTLPNEDQALKRWLRKLVRDSDGGEIRICYEAGPNGFALKRRLEALAPVICEVVAPSLTPRRPGMRVKTDRRDAGTLVRLFRAGELTEIEVPEEADEAARDLTRIHHVVTREKVRKQHHILKFLLRRGHLHPGRNWTREHRRWMTKLSWSQEVDRTAFEELLSGLRELEDRLARLNQALERLAQEESRSWMISVLRCFYGIDTLAALSLATEIFRIERFPEAPGLMNYLGLTPSVFQTGSKRRQGSISKTGNGHARWVLVQIAWHYRHPVRVGSGLKKRRKGQPAWAIEIADRAHQRLHHRFVRFLAAGKQSQQAATAVARELVGFIWEIMHEARRRRLSGMEKAA